MRSGWAEAGAAEGGKEGGVRGEQRERAVRRLLHSRRGSGDMITVSSPQLLRVISTQ